MRTCYAVQNGFEFSMMPRLALGSLSGNTGTGITDVHLAANNLKPEILFLYDFYRKIENRLL